MILLFILPILAAGDAVSLFAGMDYSSKRSLVEYRIKSLTYACVRAIYENRSGSRGPFNSFVPHFTSTVSILIGLRASQILMSSTN